MKKIAVINKNHACDNTNSVVLQMRLLRQFYTFFFKEKILHAQKAQKHKRNTRHRRQKRHKKHQKAPTSTKSIKTQSSKSKKRE